MPTRYDTSMVTVHSSAGTAPVRSPAAGPAAIITTSSTVHPRQRIAILLFPASSRSIQPQGKGPVAPDQFRPDDHVLAPLLGHAEVVPPITEVRRAKVDLLP